MILEVGVTVLVVFLTVAELATPLPAGIAARPSRGA
jgi:hypothetical protein